MIVFFDFEKVEKTSGNFREILGNFSKKIAGHKTPNFENFGKFCAGNAIKHYLFGDLNLHKFLPLNQINSDDDIF